MKPRVIGQVILVYSNLENMQNKSADKWVDDQHKEYVRTGSDYYMCCTRCSFAEPKQD